MRKFAVLLCLLLLCGLYGCAETSAPVSSRPRTKSTDDLVLDEFGNPLALSTTAPVSDSVYRAGEWDEELLPNEFPRPVTVTAEVFTLYDEASHMLGSTPCELWVLSVEVTASQWTLLDGAFADAGWVGGGTNLIDTRATEVDGAWLGAGHYAYVYRSDYDAGLHTYAVQIAVLRRTTSAIPDELWAYAPAFTEGYTHTGGDYTPDSATGERRWVFGGAGRFVGVTPSAADAYRVTLSESGFTVIDRDTGGAHWVATGMSNGHPLEIDALYTPDCRALELVYTLSPEEEA